MKINLHSIIESPLLLGRIGIGLLVLLLVACANMGTPDGGPYDENPPKIVNTSPKFGKVNSTATKVVIEFDEIVKIENAQEKVVVSPPQIEMPEIEANGRRITVSLLDSLKPNTTYTIDFADAILDNNEGNPLGDYAFTFSTGDRIDSMQVSGNVLDAADLEPIKGMLVGLYKVADDSTDVGIEDLPDSVFRTKPFERISRTDSRGHFIIKGLAVGARYRIFALDDKNQNFVYDQRSERVAFTSRIIETSCAPDVRNDTVWHDSIHYDSIIRVPYTHFYPDDVVLTAFQTAKQDLFLLKSERLEPKMFTIYFTAPSDSLPQLTGLNFDAREAFVIDASEHNDTINYWIKDSLIYNIDTLEIKMDFLATDSTGGLTMTTDTLYLFSKLTKEKIAKQEKEKWEKWAKEYRQKVKQERKTKKADGADDVATAEPDLVAPDSLAPDTLLTDIVVEETDIGDKSKKKAKEKEKKKKVSDDDIEVPPLPEEFLEIKTNNTGSLSPDNNVTFDFTEPLDTVDLSKIRFEVKQDTLYYPAKFLFRKVPGKVKSYRLYAEWEADSTYRIDIDTAAFVNIYGKRCASSSIQVKTKKLDECSTLFIKLHDADANPIVELLDANDKVVKSVKAEGNKADFYFVSPGTYYMRMFNDLNGNGIWDTGEYDLKQMPEPVYYYPESLVLKAKWELSQDWSPKTTPLAKQKPEKITKQKADKEKKSTKSRNEERLREKREGKSGKTNNNANSNGLNLN